MCKLGKYNDLILFDRGYPSRDFITFIEGKQLKYLMRVSSGFLKVVVNASKEDQVIEVTHKGNSLKMRVLKDGVASSDKYSQRPPGDINKL